MQNKIILFFLIAQAIVANAQKTKVLFIGNSYTYVNDLPQALHDLALSKGDTVIFDSYAIGGYTLEDHLNTPASLAKLSQQQWDYVVLQEQSQKPAFPPSQVTTDVLPYAKRLDSLVKIINPCAETMFYMTWGRKNGDAVNCNFYAPLCTFNGMNARLRESYMQMASDNHASVSPVGVAWKKVRDAYPGIELYQPDESHPVINGTYLAACVFYSGLFHKPAVGAAIPSAINPSDGVKLQTIASATVLDSLALWQQHGDIPNAAFTYTTAGSTVHFTSHSLNASGYLWNFGDNTSSNQASPVHTYLGPGHYTVSLTASTTCKSAMVNDTLNVRVTVTPTGILNKERYGQLIITPNPASEKIRVSSEDKALHNFKLINATGELLLYKEELLPNEQIDVRSLSKGIYYISLLVDKQYVVRKIIKD